ncbi:MAG: PKD domain-containing protein, partial [Myxococcaceae bacterium]
DLSVISAVLADEVLSCDDDGILDNTETGRLTVTLKNSGTADLAATTATVSSTNPALTFSGGGLLSFAASAPFAVITANLEVSLAGMVGTSRVPITVAFTDPGMAAPRTVTVTYSPRLNYDDLPNAATLDDVESANTRWTTAHDAQLDSSSPFRRVEDAAGTHWFGPDPASPESQWLVSPQLQVAATGSLVLSFRHRYSFEADQGVYFDGAVVELRKVGMAWADIGSKASPGYLVKLNAGTTIRGTFYPSANPLRGRDAFGGESPGYPAYITSTIDLGAAYAGATVQVRFRTGGDEAAAAAGWDIDDIGFTGITNKPFDKVVAGHQSCGNAGPVASAGEDQTVDEGAKVTLTSVASDPDGDPLTYAWTQTGGPSFALDNAAAANLTFTAPMVTEDTQLTFELVVSDPVLSSPVSTVRVLVKNVNHGPLANAGTDQTVDELSEVMLGGQGSSDSDGDAITFHWVQVGGPEVELVGADTASPGFVAPEVSEDTGLTFTLTVSDGALTSDPAMVTVTVADLTRAVAHGPAGPPKGTGCGCAEGGSTAAGVPFAVVFGLLVLAARREPRGVRSRAPRA